MERNEKGAFKSYPEGQKTKKMLEIEKRLGIKLEDDYYEYYFLGDYGQKKLANRWEDNRNLILGKHRGGRRSWVQMLSLPTKSDSSISNKIKIGCEICQIDDVPLEKAYWIADIKSGSTKFYNILSLCPNCHTKLDSGNKDIELKAKVILFYRSVCKLINKKNISYDKKRELLVVAQQIVKREL